MADTEPTNNKTRSRRRLLLSWLTVAVIVALAVITTPKPAAPEFRCYVGPPLQDGSRVTFLYPASVGKAALTPSTSSARPWILQGVQMLRPTVMSGAEAIWYRLPMMSNSFTRDIGVGVLVTKFSDTYRKHKIVLNGRSQKQYVEQTLPGYGSEYVDEIDVFDARTTRQYAFQYTHIGNPKTAEFESHKAKIMNSFQVLPPGAAVPTP